MVLLCLKKANITDDFTEFKVVFIILINKYDWKNEKF